MSVCQSAFGYFHDFLAIFRHENSRVYGDFLDMTPFLCDSTVELLSDYSKTRIKCSREFVARIALCRDVEENLSTLKSRRIKRTTDDFNFNDFNTFEDVSGL